VALFIFLPKWLNELVATLSYLFKSILLLLAHDIESWLGGGSPARHIGFKVNALGVVENVKVLTEI
jgi:hypothetical protein